MSEFTEYLFVSAPAAVAASAVISAGETALVIEETPMGAGVPKPWSIVVTPAPHEVASTLALTCIAYDFAADHGVEFTLYDRGERRARLRAASEAGHRHHFDEEAWVASRLLSKAAATKLRVLLESKSWIHDDIRDKGLRALGLRGESWLSWQTLKGEDGYQRFPIATLIEDGAEKPWLNPLAGPAEGLEEILRAEGPRRPRNGKPAASAQRVTEMEALASAFAGAAPPSSEPRLLVGDVDLAACMTPRAWLDAKKTIDPQRASDAVVAELERTVREGRFLDAGDAAVVVREGAAMLLARCIRNRVKDASAWVQERSARAQSEPEREAWEAAQRIAELKG